jgi:hypothetical protein
MSVTYSNGIGFGTKSGAAYIDLGKKSAAAGSSVETSAPITGTVVEEAPDPSKSVPWSKWGDDNLEPQRLIKEVEKTPVLLSGIDGKARFGMGLGIRPVEVKGFDKDKGEELLFIKDPEIKKFLFDSNDFMQCFGMFRDQIALNKLDCRLIPSRDGKKIAAFKREDPNHVRLGKYNNNGIIEKVYLSRQFDKSPTYDKRSKKVVEFNLLPEIAPADYLAELADKSKLTDNYFYTTFYPSWDKRYYPKPLWTAAMEWVKIAQGVPKMKAAIFENNIRIKYMVIIHESYWTRAYKGWNNASQYTDKQKEEKRKKLYDDIEAFLVGSENAYKSVFVDGYVDPATKVKVQDIEIKPIEDTTKDGELLPDSSAANSEILFALMMNPALMGADMPGGPYSGGAGSGSNIREAALVQVLIQEFERRQISRILDIVAEVNGWNKKYPDLEWRFPGLILTTKDTGSNTKTNINGTNNNDNGTEGSPASK